MASETVTTKRTVEEIVEAHFDSSSIEVVALIIRELQITAENFTDEWRDLNKAGRPLDEKTLDYYGIPRDFYELCLKVAEYEVRLDA